MSTDDYPDGEERSDPPAAAQLEAYLAGAASAEWTAAVAAADTDTLRRLAESEEGDALLRAVAEQGWMTPDWPERYGGRGLTADAAAGVKAVIRRWHLGRLAGAIGTAWLGPTILRLGTDSQCHKYLPPISRYEEFWCQLFSEPDAGSDLAAATTKATAADGRWTLKGQKIWTSRANICRRGLAVARTDPTVPKHQGLTTFCVDMESPGVTIQPIRQMTGDSEFFEVFLDDVTVDDSDRIGEVGDGWNVVRTALSFERIAGSGVGASPPGSVIGRGVTELIDTYRGRLRPAQADRLISIYIQDRLVAMNNLRAQAARQEGRPPGPETSINKILQARHTQQLQELFVDLAGCRGVALTGGDHQMAEDQWAFLRVRAKTIAGGTSEVLHNQVAERILGLPRQDDPSRSIPWEDFLHGGANR